jgi:ubiquinone/menaquinone biosynthesis C-methylase UbiE
MIEVFRNNLTRNRYNRIAFIYDLMEAPLEFLRLASWRKKLRSCIIGSRALEIGVGTGKNLPYYPPGVRISAIDFSHRMLSRARKRPCRIIKR